MLENEKEIKRNINVSIMKLAQKENNNVSKYNRMAKRVTD